MTDNLTDCLAEAVHLYACNVQHDDRWRHHLARGRRACWLLAASGVVADPAEVELWRDVALHEATEVERLRAVVDEIAALAAEHWDWKAGQLLAERLRAVLARNGVTGSQPAQPTGPDEQEQP